MKKFILMIIVSLSVIISGCASIDVAQDYDTSFNFEQLNTYAWLPDLKVELGEGRIDDHTAEMRIKNAIESEMIKKGFKKIDVGKEDFLLGFNVALNAPLVRDKMYEASYRDYGSYEVAYEIRSAYRAPSFDVGSLVLDVILPDTKKIIWRGSVQAEVHIDYTSAEKKKNRIAKAVNQLLKDFPPN